MQRKPEFGKLQNKTIELLNDYILNYSKSKTGAGKKRAKLFLADISKEKINDFEMSKKIYKKIVDLDKLNAHDLPNAH